MSTLSGLRALESSHPKVALMFGRRHRGESVKTGQEQGVDVDDPVLATMSWFHCQALEPSQIVFDITDAEYRDAWSLAQKRLGLLWVGPPHVLRHTRPSEESAQGTRSIEAIQRAWLVTQSRTRSPFI